MRDLLSRDLSLTFSHAPDHSGNAKGLEPGDTAEWFARLNLPINGPLWQPILGFSIPAFPFPAKTLEALAIAQFDALEGTGLFQWVEPNLASETQQDEAPAPTSGSRPPEWDMGPNPSTNRIRQVFTRVNWHLAQDYLDTVQKQNPELQKGEIPIAVIDTGVDYKHSELINRMYKNPGETEGNGIDDDGNGFVDDVYGIDATVPKGQDPASLGSPGAADIGGAGAACIRRSGGQSCGHGTHVAGIIAAQVGGEPSLGICDSCKIFSIRASQQCLYPDTARRGGACVKPKGPVPPGSGDRDSDEPYVANGKILDWDQIVGLNYILNFVDPNTGKLRIFIINMSLGKYLYNRTMASVLDKLEANGVLIVAAAGNDNTETPMFPAAYTSTVSVCATSEDPDSINTTIDGAQRPPTRGKFSKTDFSNFGDWVDICAPGFSILSTVPGPTNPTQAMSGTSQASPLVAGAAGLIWSVLIGQGQLDPTRAETNRSIRGRLVRYADPRNLYDPANTKNRGYGDLLGGVSNYLLGTGMLDIHGALLAESGNATASFVADEKLAGGSNNLKSGCIVSTIAGQKRPYWPLSAMATTMPFVLLQFIGAVWMMRWLRGQHNRKRRRN
jgi:subtilisin family serine protease